MKIVEFMMYQVIKGMSRLTRRWFLELNSSRQVRRASPYRVSRYALETKIFKGNFDIEQSKSVQFTRV